MLYKNLHKSTSTLYAFVERDIFIKVQVFRYKPNHIFWLTRYERIPTGIAFKRCYHIFCLIPFLCFNDCSLRTISDICHTFFILHRLYIKVNCSSSLLILHLSYALATNSCHFFFFFKKKVFFFSVSSMFSFGHSKSAFCEMMNHGT